jgi:hypothetical protein
LDLGHVLTVFADVAIVLDQPIAQLLPDMGGRSA